MRSAPASSLLGIRKHLMAALALVAALVVGLGGWGATATISGAVVAPGQLVVESEVKKVQHATGGIVRELLVRNGQHVQGGDVLLRLDETQARATLAIISRSLDELAARRARAEAELASADTINFPLDLRNRSEDVEIALLMGYERNLFRQRRTVREGQTSQLEATISQLDEEIQGYAAQIGSKVKQISWTDKELEGVRELWEKQLIVFSRVTTLEREKERLAGESNQLAAAIASARGKIAEARLKMLQIEHDMRADVAKELVDARAKTAELLEKKVAAEDQLKRLDIRAPQSGTVHQLAVHTVGGVITGQGDPIMLIVPDTDTLAIEARIPPQEIDRVYPGQPSLIRLTAFNQRTTPELNGEVTRVSADVSQDQKTGGSYYTVRVSFPVSEIARLGNPKLIPGMPAETFIQTAPRTALSYLVRPLSDQVARAFRER